jgi:phosphatidylglycerophosphatase C
MKRVAIFDLDKTLTRHPTFALWLAWWAARRAPWRLPLLALFGLLALGHPLGLASRGWLKVVGHRLLLGRPQRAALAAEADGYARWTLRHNRLAPGLAAWERERRAGAMLVIASASLDLYVEAIAGLLGADGVIATRAAWDGERLAARLDGANCYGQEKAARISAWLAAQGLDAGRAAVAVYSDSAADLPALLLADEPVAVRPDRRLAGVARARGWRILD